MTDKSSRRVLRAYSLSVEQFDHLQGIKRRHQCDIDRRSGKVAQEGDPHWISTSEALGDIVEIHRQLTSVAEREGMLVAEFVNALCLGTFIPSKGRAVQLPADAAAYLEVYRVACGHAQAIDALTEIVRTHATIAEMSTREGTSLSVIAANARVANEWHKQGVRGAPVLPEASDAVAH
ncbi:hypothetical protein [Variovorax sp. Varisp62]|uniref:hypothetical protein n=1 Tax=Variovorax sp. Varisp62 TaxID=3243049 RepID=UPI0039B4A177